jgi:hypothetical protein
MLNNFSVKLVGVKLSEDYHRPEIKFHFIHQKLFELKQ